MQDNPMILLKLPISVTDFAHISREKYFYVDKTELIFQQVIDQIPYFLSLQIF
jgi:hypothetical protein